MADSKLGEHLDGLVFLCGESPQISKAAHGHSGPGWYAHNEEYPEEGSLFVGRTEDDLRRTLEAAIAEIARARVLLDAELEVGAPAITSSPSRP